MTYNEQLLLRQFSELKKSEIIESSNGVKTKELISVQLHLDPTNSELKLGFRNTDTKYVKKELDWYNSQSLSIHPMMSDVKIWTQVCSKKGKINSNYGWCIFSEENGSQFSFAIEQLRKDSTSRRAIMQYNRPSMTKDYNFEGMSDYICTFNTNLLIRDNRLIYIVHQRSCDIIFGFFNDFAWHCHVYELAFSKLKEVYPELKKHKQGIIYNIDSFHIYERHFKLLEEV